MARTVGRYERSSVAGEEVRAFVPLPLPPARPPLRLEGAALDALHTAEQRVKQLEIAGEMVPSVDWFVYAFVRKEAVLSSQIEGTQATLTDLLTVEAGGDTAAKDVQEVCNYLDALAFARQEMRREDGLPLSMRLLNELHRRLMKGVRGATKQPGEIRRTQNWIGGTRPGNAVFVPPPPLELAKLLSDLERYVHADDDLPPLVRAALVHVQFETIHPYLDGNGRIGRLLVTLLLEHWGLLSSPLLYLSVFLMRHRSEYYRLLNEVRTAGDWEGWVQFFLEGVATTAGEAASAARDLFALVTRDRTRVLAARGTSVIAIRLMELLPRHPMLTIPNIVRLLRTTKPTAAKAVDTLRKLDILDETTGKRRDRIFSYAAYMKRLSTDSLPSQDLLHRKRNVSTSPPHT